MQTSPNQHSLADANGTGVVKPPINWEKYKNYGAYIQQKFNDPKDTNEIRAKSQARKDAKIAREKALNAEPASAEHLSFAPPVSTASDSEDLLGPWKPRKHRSEPSVTDDQTKDASLLPNSGNPSRPAATDVTASDTARSGSSSERLKSSDVPKSNGSFQRAVESSPKSRRSSSASESLPDRRKRLADSALYDDRRPSVSKHSKRTSIPGSPQLHTTETTRPTGADRQPPAWYKALPKPDGSRDRNVHDSEPVLIRMKDHIKKAKTPKGQHPGAFASLCKDVLEGLHKLIFLPMTDKLLRKTRMLDNNDGLPQLFDDAFSGGVDWPWYIKADAEEQYNKWYAKVFETDLYRGLVRGGKGTGNAADKLAKDNGGHFRLMDPKEHGNGHLINGSWYPSQLAVLRDGGHGASQGGITASSKSGAFSVIMAGGVDPKGKPYPNEDHGEEVLYCGTDNTDVQVDTPSQDTKAMLLNQKERLPVRLFRSQNLPSPYAPELGFRYDGLYDVQDYVKMDPDGERRNRYRFKLVRRAGQDPIRSEGPAKRPTKQEVDEYEKDRKNRGR